VVDGTELTSEGCKKAIELLTEAKEALEKL